MSFSENFIYLRKKAALTQEEIAERFDISRQAVSKWETGDAYPEMDKLVAICDFFQVSLDDLLQKDLSISPPAQEISVEPCEEEVRALSLGRVQAIINGLTVFFCLGFYFICGFAFHAWHPAWIVFLLIPLVGCLSGCWGSKSKIKEGVNGGVLFLSIIVYLLCGVYGQLWHVAWVVFLLVPVTGILLSGLK